MRFTLFHKSFLFSLIVTLLMIFAFIFPFTHPSPIDLSFELRPEMLESLLLVWLMPLGLVAQFLLQIGLYPGNEDTGLWGGPIVIFFFVTLFWAVIFYSIARVVQYIRLKVVALKKR